MSCISQAIIMCGGKGTRIIGLTKDLIPKCLIKFNKMKIELYYLFLLKLSATVFYFNYLTFYI